MKQQEEEAPADNVEENENSLTELDGAEKECCKINFQFYDKQKLGYVERFELPMLLTSTFQSCFSYFFLACGYNISDARLEQLNQFLDEKNATKVDL